MENNKIIDIFNKILKSFALQPVTEIPEWESIENKTDKNVLCSKLSYILMDVVKSYKLNSRSFKKLRHETNMSGIKIQNNPESRATFNIFSSCVLKTCFDNDVFKLKLTHDYYGEEVTIKGEGDFDKDVNEDFKCKDLLNTIYSSVIIQLFNVLFKKELMNDDE